MKKNSKNLPKTDFIFQRKLNLHIANLKTWSKWTLLVLGCVIIFKSYKKVLQQGRDLLIEISASAGFKLNNIVIEGQENLSVKDVLSQFNADNNTPIFLIDLNETKKILEQNDWVKHVAVMRKLPNTINIRIWERKPIAIWQYNKELFLIDEEGHPIRHEVNDFVNLPHFVGEGANLYAANLLPQIAQKRKLSENLRSIVRIGNRRWDFILKNGAVIKMPEKKIDVALQDLEEKYMDSLNENKIKALDMRDDEKYYIEQNPK